jgi:hypothetical protein
LIEKLPELARVPVDQWANAIVAIAQQDPNRVGNALDSIKRVNDLQVARGQWQQHQAAIQQQQFATYKAEQDAKFEQSVGPVTDADKSAARDYVLGVLGLTQEEASTLANNPTAIDHRFQRALLDASRYHSMMQASKALSTKPLPPVVRPGSAGVPRGNDNSSKIAALNEALDSATTETAQLNIARQILQLKGAA